MEPGIEPKRAVVADVSGEKPLPAVGIFMGAANRAHAIGTDMESVCKRNFEYCKSHADEGA
jgi:hypothetical protein